ncbi:ADP-ribosyl-[dinitrogen reductase] hydrolase [Sphingomonas kaistensis]|uniref:ADP-ribosyl-[dinitrogen reductase] hydrolase n=1 Tax=Sphingomonas kaistensis TaxID=298708 RepID=A0A7X5Y939_9SPHN|nr:ADP-ribosylglycohydrolase family protein [Sphingomonas kaistensis]NJC05771.1 ADP-ribosyl-[dinitrogen reductase] hydrolase [Sphingomonas kaistensis]
MAIKTSVSHPLQIAEISAGPGLGRVGITFCPGKRQVSAFSGRWDRDLSIDVDAIASWGAAAVLTLVEDHELTSLGVEKLGAEVRARHMTWFHLPIPDVTAPSASFERIWQVHGEGIRHLIRSGFDVLVHCKGGLGRAGTVAARLLVELGWRPDDAILEVRRVRPGAIETSAQEEHVLKSEKILEAQSSEIWFSLEDRAVGALLGLAVGDAVGTTLEFQRRDSGSPLEDMVGGGPFQLTAGEWTDDTAMALALANSLLAKNGLDELDLMNRFVSWWRRGRYSCTGTCFDIGSTTASALSHFEEAGEPIAGSNHPHSAGNGSLMRLAPVAILGLQLSIRERAALAERQSATTHGAPACLSACKHFSVLLHDAINGATRTEVLMPRSADGHPEVAEVLAGSWRGKPRNAIKSSGYVVHTLEAALWCIGRTSSFKEAVLLAANLGDDADTTAAVTGQLAGALYGAAAIPEPWLRKLAWADRIETMARALVTRSRLLAPVTSPV